jgi:chromosome segregation ATPase
MYNLYDHDSLKPRSPHETAKENFFPYESGSMTETSYKQQLKFAKEQYEDRIQSLTREVKQLYYDISGDEVVQAMRENSLSREYAAHRARELIESSLLMEKEAFISNLQDLLLQSKANIFSLEQENKNHKISMLALKEQIRLAEAKGKTHEAEIENLKGKINEISLEAEERFRAQEIKWLNTAEDLSRKELRKVQDELNRLQSERLTQGLEIEKIRKDREADMYKLDSVERENNRLKEAIGQLEERDSHWRKSYRELEYTYKEAQKQYESLLGEFEAYKSRIISAEREKEQLKMTCKSYQQQYEEEQNTHYETMQDLVSKYKSRSKKLKQKIIEQKKHITKLEKDSQSLVENLNSTKQDQERLAWDMEDKLTKISKEWERKCADIEREAQEKERNLVSKHKNDVQSLQAQYQQLMDNKLLDMQKDMEQRIANSKSVDADIIAMLEKKLKEVHENYVNKQVHEEAIKNEREKVALNFNKQIESMKIEYSSKVSRLENELREYKMQYEQVTRDLDTSMERTTYIKSELTASASRKEALEVENMQLKARVNEMDRNNKELLKQLVDACDTLEELKGLYKEESLHRQECEREIQTLHRKLKVGY